MGLGGTDLVRGERDRRASLEVETDNIRKTDKRKQEANRHKEEKNKRRSSKKKKKNRKEEWQ